MEMSSSFTLASIRLLDYGLVTEKRNKDKFSYEHEPLISIDACHVPGFIRRFRSIKIFAGQGVEKAATLHKGWLSKSRKRDPAADFICLESRQWQLYDRERLQKVIMTKKVKSN